MAEVTEVETKLKGKRGELQESKDLELREYEAILPGTSGAAAPPAEIPTSKETEIEPDIVIKEKPEEPVRLEEEAAVSEPVETAMEELLGQRRPEEIPVGEEIDPALLKQGKQALYAGEVELAVAMPVNLKMISKLYDHLQTIPELRILHTGGSWDQGTTITVVLEKQIPLISLMSKLPGVEATPELSQNDSPAKGIPSSLLRAKKGKVKRIKVTLNEG